MKKQQGFTLVELITVMLIVGILSAAAFSRFADNSVYTQALFSSKIQAYLKLAQQIALAQQTRFSEKTSISFNKISDSLWNIDITGLKGSLSYEIDNHENLLINDTAINEQNKLTFFYNHNGDIATQRITLKTSEGASNTDSLYHYSSVLKIGTQALCIVPTGYSYDGNCI